MHRYGSDDFRRLVACIVKNKVADQARRALAEKRSAHRSSDADVGELADPRGLTPVEIAALNEEAINQEMNRVISELLPLGDPIDEAIGYLKLIQDYTPQEISDWMKENQERTKGKVIKPRAIELRLKRIRERLEEMYSEYAPEP
jgi:hypothetical protein